MLCTDFGYADGIYSSSGIVSAAGSYNYAEALQKAIYFYECQQPALYLNGTALSGVATQQ